MSDVQLFTESFYAVRTSIMRATCRYSTGSMISELIVWAVQKSNDAFDKKRTT